MRKNSESGHSGARPRAAGHGGPYRGSPASPESKITDLRNQGLGLCSWVPGLALKGHPGTTPEYFRTLLMRRSPLRACDFPPGTPLNAFFAWNEARRRRDRRYTIACDLWSLHRQLDADGIAAAVCVCHLAIRPVIRWRCASYMLLSSAALSKARAPSPEAPVVAAAERLVQSLLASIAAIEAEKHAAVFQAFEELSRFVDLQALAARRPRLIVGAPLAVRRKILVIKLSALGDFVQALGPAAAIRRHHAGDEITLLTTSAFAELARQSRLFDRVLIDGRPTLLDAPGWLALRRALRSGRFDRVYDLQTSDRSSFYAWLFLPTRPPAWSGIAWHCSHPHANLGRHPQHTIDKQSEQLLMAGIYPTPLPACRASRQPLPSGLAQGSFFLLIPGSSARHPEKRWPAERYSELARRLFEATRAVPVIVGARGEEPLAAEIRAACPEATDLVGRTSLTSLADLANTALFTIGNDTGATHIAAAGGQPVVVLFSGASDPSRCAPRGREVHVLVSPRLDDLSVDGVFAQAVKAAAHSPPLQFLGAGSTTGRASA
jgi:ADP-heptose:LPS heptosyltransferase